MILARSRTHTAVTTHPSTRNHHFVSVDHSIVDHSHIIIPHPMRGLSDATHFARVNAPSLTLSFEATSVMMSAIDTHANTCSSHLGIHLMSCSMIAFPLVAFFTWNWRCPDSSCFSSSDSLTPSLSHWRYLSGRKSVLCVICDITFR